MRRQHYPARNSAPRLRPYLRLRALMWRVPDVPIPE